MPMKTILKILSLKHKNNKLSYYAISFIRLLFPKKFYQSRLNKKISALRVQELHRARALIFNRFTDFDSHLTHFSPQGGG